MHGSPRYACTREPCFGSMRNDDDDEGCEQMNPGKLKPSQGPRDGNVPYGHSWHRGERTTLAATATISTVESSERARVIKCNAAIINLTGKSIDADSHSPERESSGASL